MNTKNKILLSAIATIAIMSLTFLSSITIASVNAQNFDPIPKMPQIAEDQIITCVKDVSETSNRNSLICHIFDIDDLDWYQEIQEPNYGYIGNLNDSFEMGLID